jgi:hypothetical protein
MDNDQHRNILLNIRDIAQEMSKTNDPQLLAISIDIINSLCEAALEAIPASIPQAFFDAFDDKNER